VLAAARVEIFMTLAIRLLCATLLLTSVATVFAHPPALELSGAQEVPAVTTEAKGIAIITVGPDKSVQGSVRTSAIVATMAHIHMAEPGKNGPVIIPLTKTSDSEWSVPPGAVLTDEQYAAFKAGSLYVNVHSDAHKPGEIRAQLKP
jgi:hypothetical protein